MSRTRWQIWERVQAGVPGAWRGVCRGGRVALASVLAAGFAYTASSASAQPDPTCTSGGGVVTVTTVRGSQAWSDDDEAVLVSAQTK
jgi:hypothetical protein